MKKYISFLCAAVVLAIGFTLFGFIDNRKSADYKNSLIQNTKPAATVGMTNSLKFTPPTVRIKVGETVRWKNSSLLVHTVTADPAEATIEGSVALPEGAEAFNSGLMDPEQTFEHTFTEAGTYTYFCIPHEAAKMRGQVIVSAK